MSVSRRNGSGARPRRAILLAAGIGRRLMPHTKDRPKCLLEVAGRKILDRQIACLRSQGITEFVVVTGFEAEQVRAAVSVPATFVHNELYADTNSIYSLWLAREHLDTPCLVLNADVLFGGGVLAALLEAPVPDVVVYDSASGTDPEETKVRLTWHGRIRNIGKAIAPGNSDGEYLGIMRLSSTGCRALSRELERLVEDRGLVSAWAPQALVNLLPRRPMFAVDVAGEPWIEIDFPEDLDRARNRIAPRLDLNGFGGPG